MLVNKILTCLGVDGVAHGDSLGHMLRLVARMRREGGIHGA